MPEGNTVYIEDNANLNFIRNASIDVDGELIIGNNATINFTKYSSLRLKDAVIQPNSNLNFVDKSILIVKGNMQLEDNLIIDLFDESGMMMYNDGNVTFIGNSLINFNHSSSLYGDDVFLGSSSNYNFKDASYIESNDLTISSGASINFVHSGNCIVNNELKIEGATDVTFSNLTADNLILDAETEVSFNNFSTSVLLKKMFLINGTETSNVILNMSDNLNILFMGTVDFKMNYCNWNGGGIKVQPNTSGDLSNLEVSNSNFNNLSFPFYLDKSNATILNAHFNNNSFNFSIDNAIYSIGIDSLIIENTTFNSVQDISVFSYINNITFISNCDFSSVNKGIQVGIRYPRELSNYDKLVFILTGSTFVNTEIGVDAAMDDLDSIYISGNNLDVNDIGISVVEFLTENVDLTIINNEIRNANTAISLIEGSEAVITKNTLVDNTIGVYVSQVSNPFVINNAISAENISTPGSGIVLLSSDGVIRKNSISGHSNGIELGNSSPDIGDNTITDNLYHGIYIGSGSLPNMVGTLAGSPPLQYPTAGYNDIYENGGWDDPNAPPDNDGSEILLALQMLLWNEGAIQ